MAPPCSHQGSILTYICTNDCFSRSKCFQKFRILTNRLIRKHRFVTTFFKICLIVTLPQIRYLTLGTCIYLYFGDSLANKLHYSRGAATSLFPHPPALGVTRKLHEILPYRLRNSPKRNLQNFTCFGDYFFLCFRTD